MRLTAEEPSAMDRFSGSSLSMPMARACSMTLRTPIFWATRMVTRLRDLASAVESRVGP
jgi:hypothetical protein